MANLVKPKLGISLFSVAILILFPLLETNFYSTATIKRWGQLSWDDFQGIARPFSKYGAGISSAIYLEYDSSASRYRAYAGQNNMYSWANQRVRSSEYGLNHEQYHFNITEFYARLLNEYIEANPGENESTYLLRLASLDVDLQKMQNEYDLETDHSLNRDKQRRWEYKIDSLLMVHSSDSGWVQDYYSGARIYFPAKPEFHKGLFENIGSSHEYFLKRYDMTLVASSFHAQQFLFPSLEGIYAVYYKEGAEIKSVTVDPSHYSFKATVISEDSLNNTSKELWVYDNDYMYRIIAKYPNDFGDTTGYSDIARSFINSFSIENTDDYWFKKLESSNAEITYAGLRKKGSPQDFKYCITEKGKTRGFFRGPFFREDGALFLAQDLVEHDDSLLYKNILQIGNDTFTYEPDKEGHLYFVPADKIPDGDYILNFGYLLMKDSVSECYPFYHQSLEVAPPVNPNAGSHHAPNL
jgi:hypothetical protein